MPSPLFFVLRLRTIFVVWVLPLLLLAWWWVAPQFVFPVLGPTEHVSGKLIVIDAGHGGADPGAVGRAGILEKDVVLAVAQELQVLLHRAAMYTLTVRDGDYDLAGDARERSGSRKQHDLSRRVALANDADADLYISLHANSFPSPQWSGAQTFYYPGKQEDKTLAEAIQARFQKAFPSNRRRARPGEYFVLNHTRMPAVVVEVGFLSNPDEERLLASPAHQRVLAESVFWGIVDYFTHRTEEEKRE